MDISTWVKTKVNIKKSTLPRYFILEDIGKAKFFHNLANPKDYENIGDIKIKWSSKPLKILIAKKLLLSAKHIFQCSNNFNESQIPILKSNLQKCIRRSKEIRAVSTAYIMLSIDPNSLLRRLPIIFIEDVQINSSFTEIIWYMIASSKNYVLSDNDVKRILSIISILARLNFREFIQKNHDLEIDNIQNYIDKIPDNYYHNNFDIIWGLLIRYLYGGMKCDKLLILNVLDIYIKHEKNFNLIDIQNICLTSKIYNFQKKYIILPSIDFHCTNILYLLLKKFGLDQTYENTYKECIWFNRSCLNNKRDINNYEFTKKYDELYRCIKRDLDLISIDIINSSFKNLH